MFSGDKGNCWCCDRCANRPHLPTANHGVISDITASVGLFSDFTTCVFFSILHAMRHRNESKSKHKKIIPNQHQNNKT